MSSKGKDPSISEEPRTAAPPTNMDRNSYLIICSEILIQRESSAQTSAMTARSKMFSSFHSAHGPGRGVIFRAALGLPRRNHHTLPGGGEDRC